MRLSAGERRFLAGVLAAVAASGSILAVLIVLWWVDQLGQEVLSAGRLAFIGGGGALTAACFVWAAARLSAYARGSGDGDGAMLAFAAAYVAFLLWGGAVSFGFLPVILHFWVAPGFLVLVGVCLVLRRICVRARELACRHPQL